jgi:hypothetical protein
VLASVQITSDFNSNTAGLLQIGEVEASNVDNDCFFGGGSGTDVFVEYKKEGQTTFTCPVTVPLSDFGYGSFFSVTDSSADGLWEAKQDGGILWSAGSSFLGFSTGYALAFAETEFANGAPQALAMTYGPTGHNAWQYTTNGGANWQTVISGGSSPVNLDTDGDASLDGSPPGGGDWFIYSPPSPFNVNFDVGHWGS